MDGFFDMAANGLRAIRLRAHRHGDRSRISRRFAPDLSALAVIHRSERIAHRQHDHDRRGSRRHGRCRRNADSYQLTVADHSIWRSDNVAVGRFSYDKIAFVLKWLTLALFAYVVTPFVLKPNWGTVLRDAFVPSWPRNHQAWQALVAILGTTISPYLFFWQASQEVEEQKAKGRRRVRAREGATKRELTDRKLDVGVGTFFSNLVMFFIILTAALTLHAHNKTNIQSSRDVAQALEPLAGSFAATLYTLGVVGTGLLAIPVLAGSSAYAFADTFVWKEGLDLPVTSARYFYAIIGTSTIVGMVIGLLKINPIQALFWASIINGVLAPFLLVAILVVSSNRGLMHRQPSSWLARIIVAVTAVLMFLAAVAMFIL